MKMRERSLLFNCQFNELYDKIQPKAGKLPTPSDPARAAFFTTIPIAIGTTGQGTGLGLSLAYDIVKAHGGTIEVYSNYCPTGGDIKLESKIEVGTKFIIVLPC